MSAKTVGNDFTAFVKKIESFNNASNVLYWDMRTKIPRKGMDARSEVVSTLSTEAFKLSTSDQMGEFLETLSVKEAYEELDHVTQRLVDECKREYDLNKKIPADRFQEYVLLKNKSENLWEEAREKNDFALFQSSLEQVIDMTLEFIEYWGVKESKYDTLLDQYEPGITTKDLDQIFGQLREKTVPLLQAIQESGRTPDIRFFKQSFSLKEQEDFNRYMLTQIGFDFEAGRLDTSIHPFCIDFGATDVRLTTRYDENDLRYALLSSMHEAGHGIYEQNIDLKLQGLPLDTGASMGVHESQSRFYENMIGRSLPFWEHYYPELQKAFPAQLSHISLRDFHRAINLVEPSLIRTEADELTYNLHIMLRYELEKGLINQSIRVADLPELWQVKMKEYLGIEVPNDQVGVLQDVHWSGGLIGYFPTYSLGNVYSAQFANAMQQQLPSYDELLRQGNLAPINEWLRTNIQQHGKLKTPKELLLDVTGEGVNATYLVDYLEKKFKAIYEL
ncbi:carboxypeptidase M32 [Brevibacillus daliensis]|uniref:carboxypeptidase M32 n=1 Tax=Brevibacillus daliensis TaxID=2892995 RepID=UPI001E5E9CBD|nr:carboxypeptidase M32 [Brevibacillus daliensis]